MDVLPHVLKFHCSQHMRLPYTSLSVSHFHSSPFIYMAVYLNLAKPMSHSAVPVALMMFEFLHSIWLLSGFMRKLFRNMHVSHPIHHFRDGETPTYTYQYLQL